MRWLPASVRPSSVVSPVLSADCNRRNLLITLIIRCVNKTLAYGMMRKWNKKLANFLSQWRYSS